MIPGAVQHLASQLARGFAWTLGILALTCLALWACVTSSSGPQKSQPDQRLYAPPEIPAGIRGDQLEFIPASGSRAELRGTATIGSWRSRSTDIYGQIILNADEKALDALFDRIQTAAPNDQSRTPPPLLSLPVRSPPIGEISLPVMSFRGGSSGMDRDMQNALKAGQHPAIEYVFQQLQQATVQWNPRDGQASLKLRIVGNLTMAGVARPIAMELIVTRDSRRHFLAHAQTRLWMSDFGVTPPVALFGLIKAGNQVLVIFDLDFVLAK